MQRAVKALFKCGVDVTNDSYLMVVSENGSVEMYENSGIIPKKKVVDSSKLGDLGLPGMVTLSFEIDYNKFNKAGLALDTYRFIYDYNVVVNLSFYLKFLQKLTTVNKIKEISRKVYGKDTATVRRELINTILRGAPSYKRDESEKITVFNILSALNLFNDVELFMNDIFGIKPSNDSYAITERDLIKMAYDSAQSEDYDPLGGAVIADNNSIIEPADTNENESFQSNGFNPGMNSGLSGNGFNNAGANGYQDNGSQAFNSNVCQNGGFEDNGQQNRRFQNSSKNSEFEGNYSQGFNPKLVTDGNKFYSLENGMLIEIVNPTNEQKKQIAELMSGRLFVWKSERDKYSRNNRQATHGQNSANFDNQASFDNQTSFDNQADFNNQTSFDNQADFNNQTSFDNQADFNNQAGFDNQANFKPEEDMDIIDVDYVEVDDYFNTFYYNSGEEKRNNYSQQIEGERYLSLPNKTNEFQLVPKGVNF